MNRLPPSILHLSNTPYTLCQILASIPRIQQDRLTFKPMEHQVLRTTFYIAVKFGLVTLVIVNCGGKVTGVVPPTEAEGGTGGAGGVVAEDGFVRSDLECTKVD